MGVVVDLLLGEALLHTHTVEDISDIADNYVSKFGDTMTGPLIINKSDSINPPLTLSGNFDPYTIGATGYMFQQTFTVDSTINNARSLYGNYQAVTMESTSAQIGFLNTAYYSSTIEDGAGDVIYGVQGITNDLQISNTLTASILGMYSSNWVKSTGTVPQSQGVWGFNWVQGTATWAKAIIGSNLIQGTVTNNANFYSPSVSGATNNYAWYSEDGLHRMGGAVNVIGSSDTVQLLLKSNSTQTSNIAEIQDNAGNADIFVIDTNERVGIGVDTPLDKLHVLGTARIVDASGYGWYITSDGRSVMTTTGGIVGLTVQDTNNALFHLTAGSHTTRIAQFGSGNFEIIDNDLSLTRLAITSGGRVGISESSPSGKFQITGTADEPQFILRANSTQTTDWFQYTTSGGTKYVHVNRFGTFNLGQPTETGALNIRPSFWSNAFAGVYVRDTSGASYTGKYFHANNNGTDIFYVTRSLLYCNVPAQFTSGISNAIATVTASSVTLDSTYYTVLCDTSSNAITVNLPAAASHSGRIYNIKVIDNTNNVTVDGNGSETIDGSTTQILSSLYTNMQIQSDGSNWHIL